MVESISGRFARRESPPCFHVAERRCDVLRLGSVGADRRRKLDLGLGCVTLNNVRVLTTVPRQDRVVLLAYKPGKIRFRYTRHNRVIIHTHLDEK